MARRHSTFPTQPPGGAASSFYEETTLWPRPWGTSKSLFLEFHSRKSPKEQKGASDEHEIVIWQGVIIHLVNAFLSLFIVVYFVCFFWHSTSPIVSGQLSTHPWVGVACTCFSQIGLVFENLVNATGKYLGEGSQLLKRLSKGRVIFHVVGIPLLLIPTSQIALAYNLLSSQSQVAVTIASSAWSLYELGYWWSFDTQELKLVDLRRSTKHQGSYLAGTLAYSSGKFLELVLPPVLVVFLELMVGLTIVLQDSDYNNKMSGMILLVSSILTFASSANPKRPDIQLFVENVHGAMLLTALAAVLAK